MKLNLDICKTCSKFEHLENGKIGCSLIQDERWIYTIGEEGMEEKWSGLGFKPIGNVTLRIDHKTVPFDEKTFESLDVNENCEMYAEYCVDEWNKEEKDA